MSTIRDILTFRRIKHHPLEWLIFVSLFITYAYFFHKDAGYNVNTRISLVYALVDQGTFRIDAYHDKEPYYTMDKAYYNGHYYSDKIIGLSLLGAIPYTALRLVGLLFNISLTPDVSRYVIRVFTTSLLAAACAVVLFRLLLLFGATSRQSLLLVFICGLGTLFLPYATVFYPYLPALFFVLISYRILLRYRLEQRFDEAPLFLAGLALGTALLCEYIIGIVALGLVAYVFIHLRARQHIWRYLMGSMVPLIPFLLYTLSCFGRVTIPYKYEVDKIFAVGMGQGFLGITSPNMHVLYYITIHPYRGIFFSAPVLLLYFLGVIPMTKDRRFRSDAVLALYIVAGYLLFNSSYYMWWGGWAVGPRFLIPMIPFMIPPLVFLLRDMRFPQFAIVVLGIMSIAMTFIPAAIDPQPPQGYHTAILLNAKIWYNLASPILLIQFPAFFHGRIATNFGSVIGLPGLAGLIPLGLFWLAIGVALHACLARRNTHAGESRDEPKICGEPSE